MTRTTTSSTTRTDKQEIVYAQLIATNVPTDEAHRLATTPDHKLTQSDKQTIRYAQLIAGNINTELADFFTDIRLDLDNVQDTVVDHENTLQEHDASIKAILQIVNSDDFMRALKAQQKGGGSRSFRKTLVDSGYTHDQIDQVFVLGKGNNQDMSDAEMFSNLFMMVVELHERVDVIQEELSRTPWMALGVSALVGLLAGLLFHSHTWTRVSSTKTGNVTNTTTTFAALDTTFAAVLFGFGIGALVFIIALMFSNRKFGKKATAVDSDNTVTTEKSTRKSWFKWSRRGTKSDATATTTAPVPVRTTPVPPQSAPVTTTTTATKA